MAAEILAALERIAVQGRPFAVGWHVVVAIAGAALLAGWRPSQRAAALWLTAPLASVAMAAVLGRSPFNAVVFAMLSLGLAVGAWRMGQRAVVAERGWPRVVAAAMIALGWCYPHFLAGEPAWSYLYAAPLGLLPCPTLSLLVGAAMLGGVTARGWRRALAAAGLFYGAFGAFVLGVTIDTILLAGAALLLARTFGGMKTD